MTRRTKPNLGKTLMVIGGVPFYILLLTFVFQHAGAYGALTVLTLSIFFCGLWCWVLGI
jgi:hypothetical protein